MLTSYNFQINHIQGTKNERVNILSRRADYVEEIKLGSASIFKRIKDQLTYRLFIVVTIA